MVTIEQAMAHLRLDDDEEMVELYLDAAMQWVKQYLNRRIFESQDALSAAKGSAQADLIAASSQRDAQIDAARQIADDHVAIQVIEQAETDYRLAVQAFRETMAGMVSVAPIDAATLLVLGDLYENREASIVGVTYEPNPSVINLLAPYRVGMGV